MMRTPESLGRAPLVLVASVRVEKNVRRRLLVQEKRPA